MNVLIVDDSSVIRSIIEVAMRLGKVPTDRVLHAADGVEALRILRNEDVDFVFTDINMPEMNGEQLVEAIRRDPKFAGLPIVVISTDGSESRIEHLRRMRTGFIHKPFRPEAVIAVMQESASAAVA